jgi:eukaryotic-like serine/threonine-protein kinase
MEIFSEAALLTRADCAAYLDSACGGDDELRSEVESLLSTSEQASGFLCAATAGGAEIKLLEAAALEDDRSIEKTGAIGGRYSIIERLGEGGWGVVYSARQSHPIRRDVALKIVKLGTDSRSIIARFDSERQSLAMMDHPNIARIFDAGTTDDGRPCFAMELVRGVPITDYCDAQRFSISRRLELFAAVCQAVQHAHQKGIIHRDLKPSNVLVTTVDGVATPKVIDFGIAKAVGAAATDPERRGELRYFLGTPQYMSPEQAAGGDGDVDTRSDVYSLGVLLYELLVGTTPRDPRTLREMSCEQARRLIAEQEPPTPVTRLVTLGDALPQVAQSRGVDARKLRRILSGDLQWIVIRAMATNRSRRYETAGALCDEVWRYLANQPLRSTPPNSFYHARKFIQRHRQPLLGAVALVLALLLGLAGTTFGLIRAQQDRRAAQTALAQAQQISEFLSGMLGSADPDRAHGRQLLVRDLLDRSGRELDQGSLKGQPLVEAGIRLTLGNSYESLGMFPQAQSQLRKSLEIRQRLLGNDNLETARSMVALAWILHDNSDLTGAEQLTRRALAIQERTLGQHDREVVSTLINLSEILRDSRDPAGAAAVASRAVALSDKLASGRDLRATALTNLGVARMDTGDLKTAEPLIREALAIDRQLHGEHFRNVPRNMGNLAVILDARSDRKGAIELWTQALRLQRQMLPRDHPDIAWNLRSLGDAKSKDGDLPGAEIDLREAVEIDQRVYGPMRPILTNFFDDLAAVLAKQAKLDEASLLRAKSLQIRLKQARKDLAAHPQNAYFHGVVGELQWRAGDFTSALAELTEAFKLAPREPLWTVELACLDLFLGDDVGYRACCRRIVDNQLDLSDPVRAADAAQVCLLWAPATADLPRISELPRRLAETMPPRMIADGLIELRRGNSSAAQALFHRLLLVDHDPADDVTTTFYLALCLAQDGDVGGAWTVFESAEADFAQLPKICDGDLTSDFINVLVCHIARREARAALGLVEEPTTRSAR